MPLKINRSQLRPDFAVAAAAHAKELRDWRAHMVRVAADAAAGIPLAERHQPYPAPRADALVAAAVNENDEVEFEIVEDGPTPGEQLRSKQIELMAEVARAEERAIDAIVPFGKRRIRNLREQEIAKADAERRSGIISENSGLTKRAAEALGLRQALDVEAEVAAGRPAQDTAFLDEQSAFRAKEAAIRRAAAEATAAIEDLTIETIDSFDIPDLIKA